MSHLFIWNGDVKKTGIILKVYNADLNVGNVKYFVAGQDT